jgi:hypothetical protein
LADAQFVEYAQSAPSLGHRGRLGWGRSLNSARSLIVNEHKYRPSLFPTITGEGDVVPNLFQHDQLGQAVTRNTARFPADFHFYPTEQELRILKSQIVTSSWGGARKQIHADEQFAVVFKAIRDLMDDKSASEKAAAKPKRKIGFT